MNKKNENDKNVLNNFSCFCLTDNFPEHRKTEADLQYVFVFGPSTEIPHLESDRH